jgi:uncharacterized protein DUF4432
MPNFFGKTLTRDETLQRMGRLSQVAGVELLTYGDGVERGVRCLEFRTGTGFIFKVLLDRCMDVGHCEYRGLPLSWHSPTGFAGPWYFNAAEEGGLGGFMRGFTGMFMTCGFDHILFMAEDDASWAHYPPRRSAHYPLHGVAHHLPARLNTYGHRWEGDRCVLFAEGEVTQARVFGEHLKLTRRYEAVVGESCFRMRDVIENAGYYDTPHMYLYHINVGWPALDAGSEYVAPIRRTLWMTDSVLEQRVSYRRLVGPQRNFVEQVYEHELAADADGRVPLGVLNRALNEGRGFGVAVEWRRNQFPHAFEWQNFAAGQYAIGLEPSTNHVMGRKMAREEGTLIMLAPGETREYELSIGALDGAVDLDAFAARVRSIAPLLEADIPTPTEHWGAHG